MVPAASLSFIIIDLAFFRNQSQVRQPRLGIHQEGNFSIPRGTPRSWPFYSIGAGILFLTCHWQRPGTYALFQQGFPFLALLLQAEQMLFMIRIFCQDQVKAFALLQVGTLITMFAPPIDGADTDGAAIQPTAAPAPRAFGMGEKPLQANAEFRQGKTLVSPKTMSPPVNPKLVHEAFHPGNSFQEFGVVQLTFVT
jgi:hypothetical protein